MPHTDPNNPKRELSTPPLLSAVLITRNQRWNVDRLLGSVLSETEGIRDAEVVLVDSSSTDGTPEEAARFPIRVVRIRDGEFIGPSAGRYVGYGHSTGRYVLFLDGDTELYPGWLERALALMESHPEIAVASGREVSLSLDAGPNSKPPPSCVPDDWREVPHGGGKAIYRRSVLEEVGSFNPWLRSDEEPELCIRIRHAGYRVMRSRSPSVFEYEDPKWRVGTVLGRWRRGLYFGAGQCLRLHLGQPTFRRYVAERGFGLAPLGIMVVGLGAVAHSILTRNTLAVSLWLALVVAGIVVFAVRRRTFRGLAHSLVLRVLIADGTVRGFIHGVRPVDEYTPKVDVIRAGPDDEDRDHTK